MTKTSSKIISIIFGVIAIYFTLNLIPDKTKKEFTALDKQYSFTEEITISEKFKTDFDSAYRIWFSFENSSDSLLPIKKNLKVLRNGKPVELYGDKNNCFVSKSGATYELNIKLENAEGNSNLNKINIKINEDGLPGPTYELYFEREYKWLFWTIDGILIFIALITGYFGFRKKPADNTVYN
ncbi:hypothetical protein HNV10_17080 [Winogradskyella litoriviva]|uniref:Uncharacterized protein n=1 Tax=Winogradskyella litoriviva TaxID=1220182 RepID=A0ABX2EBS1_9FLAO|nr:hypothetical protein [Winogradskyella litoriviva]NRD24967.1 hypothetical protein [Winogradskyella litoriviva]